MAGNLLYGDVFEGDPLGRRSLFESFAPGLKTNFQRDIFSGMFDRVLNNYLGVLGSEVRSGGVPAQTFTDFLNQQDFGRQFRRLPSSESGRDTSPLRSAAQFIFNR